MVLQVANPYLLGAGILGCLIALVHGFLQQKLIIRPLVLRLEPAQDLGKTALKLIVALLHFSTAAWFAGGVALILVASLNQQTQLVVGLLVMAQYSFAAIANFWATRGRHPGWVLLAIANAAILVGIA